MGCKYCNDLTSEQYEDFRNELHKKIHWLLIYKEKGYIHLDEYFSSLMFKIGGLNSLLGYPPSIMDLLCLLESARQENLKPDCDFKLYRKAILDAHSAIDRIFDERR